MPTVSHETPLELLRQEPMLALALLHVANIHLTGHVTATMVPTDLSILWPKPTDRRGDSVILLEDSTGHRVGVVAEIQLDRDDSKIFRWPFYLARARDLNKSQGVLVVVCRTSAMARWCRQVIRTGHPGNDLIPVVVEAGNTPDPYTPGLARIMIELIILAVHTRYWNLRDPEVRERVLNIVGGAGLETDRLKIYARLILYAAGKAARKDMERLMAVEQKMNFTDRIEANGVAKGLAKGKAEAILGILKGRCLPVSEKTRATLLSCTDLPVLDAWLGRALRVDSADAIFNA